MKTLYLASASPRRLALLRSIGFEPVLLKAEIEEKRAVGESPAQYCARVAREKAQAGFATLSGTERAGALVLGADTEVVLDDEVFGKPADTEDAMAMLRRLRGSTHQVITAICAISQDVVREGQVCSRVRFKNASDAALLAYVRTQEPFGKAGAYAIQGLGATLIEHLDGSHSSVMGLPVFETSALLNEFGLFAPWQEC